MNMLRGLSAWSGPAPARDSAAEEEEQHQQRQQPSRVINGTVGLDPQRAREPALVCKEPGSRQQHPPTSLSPGQWALAGHGPGTIAPGEREEISERGWGEHRAAVHRMSRPANQAATLREGRGSLALPAAGEMDDDDAD